MSSSRFSECTALTFAILIAIFFFAPAVYAQTCDQDCMAWSPCDQPCDVCIEESIDGCVRWRGSTCGESGACGGCGVSSSRTATLRSKTGPQDGGATYCIGRQYWYGSTNWSQYQRYSTEVCTVTYQTTTCADGTSTEQEVSRSCQYGECYEFTNGDCQTGDTVLGFDIHGRECYF